MNIMAMKLFLSGIDGIIYDTLAKMYNLIFEIAQADVFSDDAISDFTIRIYTILGIFMLFKISFSFIKYIINPDSFIDKKTGFQKVIVNIILVFVMLISFPWVFSILKDAQVALLEDNVLGNFIIGSSPAENKSNTDYLDRQIKWSNSCDGYIVAATDGDYLSLSIFRPFFQYNSHFSDEEDRKTGVLCDGTTSYDQVVAETKTVSSFITYDKVLGPEDGWQVAVQAVAGVIAFAAIPGVGDVINAAAVDYQVKYLYILSSIVGIMVCALLISFGFDIAVRSIKLAFLQIIAPIPIISYIEPDSSKQTMFKTWISEVGKTWISLFVRLGALYLVIYVLQLLNMSDDKSDNSIWIKMFFIIGALMFAKKLPSLLQTLIPGLKLDGEFTLNPLKKIGKEALGGVHIENGAKAIGAGTLGAIGGGIAGFKVGGEVGNRKRFAFSGALNGAISGGKAKKGGIMAGANSAYQSYMGKDFVKLSPDKMLPSSVGEKKIAELKEIRKSGYDRKNNAESKLAFSTTVTNNLGNELVKSGVDVNNMSKDVSYHNAEVAKLQQALRNNNANTNNNEKLISELNIELKKPNINAEEKNKIIKQLEDADKNRFELKGKSSSIESQLEISVKSRDYCHNLNSQNDLRKEISQYNKDLETIGNEISQVAKAYSIDLSPREDVDKAKSNLTR